MVVDVKLVAKPHIAISTDTTIGKAPHYFDELPHEDEVRLGNLFKVLDLDGNGKIDIHDLSEALREFGLHHRYAQSFLERADANKSSDLSLAEFIQYVREHEKNLRLGFSHIDRNKDGKVDLEELIMAFKELGVDVEVNEAKKLLQRMDQDGSLEISFNEWRDFLLYAPSTDIHDLIRFWRHSTVIKTRYRSALDEDIHPAVYFVEAVLSGTVWHVGRKDAFSRRTASVLTPTMSSGAVVMEVTEEYLDIGEDMNVPDDFTQSEMQSGMWWRHLVAGGVAGAVSRTCTAPLDRLKVYLQVHGNKSTGIRKCLKHMLIEGGWLSLWRGNGINVLKIAPESALKFMAYEQLKRLIRQQSTARDLTIYERFVAGSLAGGFSQTIIYPLEVLKTRLALRKTGEFKSIMDAAMKIYKREGWKAFYKGYVPNLLGIIPYAGIDLAVYETLKNNYLRQHCDGEAPSAMLLLACGTASSTCGQVCSYPLALVRTKLQAQVITNVGSKINNHNTMTSLIKEIVREEGWAGLYRGITPNFMKVAPAVSISYVVYERCRQALGVNMT